MPFEHINLQGRRGLAVLVLAGEGIEELLAEVEWEPL